MDSAKLIAVKEVELDVENDEKAKQVEGEITCKHESYGFLPYSNTISCNWRLIYCVV